MTSQIGTEGTADIRQIRRTDDDELLGTVAPVAGGFAALSVFGGLLGTHPTADDAAHQVREIGLSSLAERWWIHHDGHWQPCWPVEASSDRLVAVIASSPYLGRPATVPPGTPLQLAEPVDS